MQFVTTRFRATLLLIGLPLSASLVWAVPCKQLLGPPGYSLSETQAFTKELTKKATLAGVPLFMKKAAGGERPVLLLNSQTRPAVDEYLEHSIGTQIILQPDWNNDHGGFRLGKYLIDVDTPTMREYGEVNGTGLSWREVASYLPRRDPTDYVIIEVTYRLSDEELQIADYYQKVRRAALFRVPFTFSKNAANYSLKNSLHGGGEHCFLFCKATQIGQHFSEIGNKIQELTGKTASTITADPQVITYLESVRAQLGAIVVKPMDRKQLVPTMFFNEKGKKFIQSIAPEVAADQQAELLNWIIAYDATEQYQVLIKRLGITGSFGAQDMNHARATAVMIYDGPEKSAQFLNATYQAQGKSYAWPQADQHPAIH